DTDAGADLGEDVTDARGAVAVTYHADPAAAGGPRTLRLLVSGPRLADPVTVSVPVDPSAPAVTAVAVRAPPPARRRALAAGGLIALGEATLARLEAAGVVGFAEIRRRGGPAGVPELAGLNPATAHRLGALADLDRLATTPAEVDTLLASG